MQRYDYFLRFIKKGDTSKLQPPDWNNKDIYKTILPIGVGTLNNKENDK